MKRKLILIFSCLLVMLLSSCTQVTNPLLRSEATPIPGTGQQLHSATAMADGSTRHSVTLYFRFLDSAYLAGETRIITVRPDESLEQAIVSALLDGPSAGQIELTRLIGDDVTIEDISVSGDMLFLTLNSRFLRDGVPDNWQAQQDWAQEAPLFRQLTLQSIVATITENLPYSGVQVLISTPGESSARLDRSYYLRGDMGPADPLLRDDTLLMTPARVTENILEAWKNRDFASLHAMTASFAYERPVQQDFASAVDAAPPLMDYSISDSNVSADGQHATVTVSLTFLQNEISVPLTAYPLHLVRDNGLWKISYETLLRLMLR